MKGITLDQIPLSQLTTVRHVKGDTDFVCRMYELGVIPGALLTVANRAPFSGPLHLVTPRFSFFMRKTEAQQIFCED